ncbi:MAG: hypothetical protein HY231_11850 [Acidobacteria bacterium]|nr:hypothetical protein [Acidobacteriota bacterium]
MENYNSATALKRHGHILTALSDLPNSIREKPAAKKLPTPDSVDRTDAAGVQREAGDQINCYMLCTLVSKSAKRIKISAERAGVFLPMTLVTRSVLRSYRLAAKDKDGPLATSNPDIKDLANLNQKILASLLKQRKDPPKA